VKASEEHDWQAAFDKVGDAPAAFVFIMVVTM
jgi:hypothetical protein